MECASDGTIIRVKELDRSFTIPKRREENSTLLPETIQSCTEHKSILESECESIAKGLKRPASNYKKHKKAKDEERDVHYRRIIVGGDLTDTSLPNELQEQIQPLSCGVCNAQLTNTINAKIHYASKNHDKKVKKFLIEYSQRTGEPLHKRAKVEKKLLDSEDNDPKYFHCQACDLPLTGKAHAESHYMGKIHQKVICGKRQPSGKGYINDNGQWKRTFLQTDPSGRNGFGETFAALESYPEKVTSLNCELCQVKVTSFPQMESHIQGIKHQKRLKNSGVIETLATSNPDFCPYRTPSGQFYCKSCNIVMNSENQFTSHLQSRNHMKKRE